MIRILIAITVCVASAFAWAEEKQEYITLNSKTSTEAEYRTVYEQLLSASNAAHAASIFWKTKFSVLHWSPLNHLIPEFDEGLANKYKADTFISPFWGKFIKNAQLSSSRDGADKMFPKIMKIRDQYHPIDCLSPTALDMVNVPVEGIIEVLDECVRNQATWSNRLLTATGLRAYKTIIQKKISKTIKRKMREKGMSFVAQGTASPVTEYLARLNAALDAPNFVGLNEWLSELGYDVQIDSSKYPTEDSIKNLKEAIFYGDKNMTARAEVILLVGLGVEGYNQFVKEYNSGK